VQLEARVKAFSNSGETYVCASILNIHVFDFVVTEDDVNLDTEELEIDLAGQNELLAKLFGSSSIDVNLGKNLSFGVSVDGSRVEMTLGGTYDKSFEKGSVGAYASYEDGYEANHQAHNKNTYFFQFKDVYTDKDGVKHNLTYNVRFARGTEKSNYFYYRCYVYEGDYKNEVAKFFGAVNGLNDSLAKVVGARTYRERVASKALMIYKVHLTMANKEAKTVKDISKLDSSAIYIEAIAKSPSYTNSHSFDVELSGKLIFEYDRENGLKPVSSEIHGELYYTFNHNSQFVVWVIPVVLEVEVKVGGEVDITLKFDADRGISLDEAKLTLSAAISAKVGVGCSVASIGVYGSIGTVFVLDFYPELGVDSWTLNGEIGAYMKVLWYTKQFTIAKFDNYELMNTTAENISMAQTMAELYLVENYSSDDLDPCAGNARIVCVGDQIYRISYIDASDRAGYDTYNYRKLAVAAWDGSDWSEAVIIDDNHKNDASYDLYCTEEEMYVVFTQQSEVLTGESVDDTYASSANMVIKVAKITDLNDAAVTTVHTGSYYKYLPTITQANGVLTVAWVENADNNMFGVSPQNYIDEKGESYIVATTANAVYTSTLADDDWLTPVKVQDGLAPVTDVALGTNGTVCYIVDGNSDLGDSEDRVLYTVADEAQTPIAVNDPQSGSVTNVEADGNSVVYYFSSANETQSSGLRWLNAPEGVIPSLSNVDITSDKYKILRDESGNITAVFFTAVKAWQENEKSVDGSAIYAMFYNDGQWGQPVELGVFPAEPNVYISHFDVMYKTDASVMIVADFVDQNGLLLQQLTEENFLLETDLKVTEYQVDYVNRILAVTVANNGAKTAQLQTSVDGQEKVTYDLKIPSGSSQTISVTLPKESLQPVVKVYDSLKADAVCTISDIQLNYSDISPYAKQLLLGAQNKLLLAVKNTGVQNNAGYLIVRPGNYDAETIQAAELLAAAEQTYGGEIPQAGPIAVNDDEQGLFWIVRVAVEPGAISHYEIPLDEAGYIQNNGLFSIYAYVDDSLEKGNAAENNIVYVSYQQLTGVLEELPRPAISVSLTEKVVLNFYVPEDLVNERNQIVVKYNGEVMDASRYVVAPETATKEYRISIPLNANNMCDELSLQVWSANGVPVTQERTTSIRDYVRLRLDSAKASDKEKRVFIAALDYGALAQLAMDANTADLANSIVTEKDRELLTDFAWPTATNTADAAIGSTDESKFAVTASLKDAVVLNFYIYKTDLGADKIQIKRNGAVLTAGEDYTITEVGKEYCVSIPMNANHMCDIFSAQVVDAEGNAVHAARSLSMRHYVGMRLANPKATEAEKRVFIAALDYGALAQLAVSESATDLANRYITAADRENLNP